MTRREAAPNVNRGRNRGGRGVGTPAWWPALFAAWLVALAATMGALFIGEIMGQAPCPLCWHQRIAMFPLVVILGLACLFDDPHVWRYGASLAAVGFGLALWHSLLYFGVAPRALEPCGAAASCSSAAMTILGGVPIPALSLAAFALILGLLWRVRRKART